MLLAIDTATRLLSLAVHDGTQIQAEQTWQAPNAHTELLADAITDILQRAAVSLADISALAVVTGPGSYAGVRIGVSLAKGLAAARQLPAVGVTTLDTLAAGQPHYSGTLIAVVAAGRGRVIAGRYRWSDTRWMPRGEPRLLAWQDLLETIDSHVTLAGELDASAHESIAVAKRARPELKIDVAPAAYSLRRASFAAEVAWARLQEASPSQYRAAKLLPVYVATAE